MYSQRRAHSLLLLAVLTGLGQSQIDESLVDYYDNLIDETIQGTTSYVSPKNAKKFQGNYYQGVDPIDYGYFDFVIIGSGATGAALASRLAKGNDKKILLLEAGKRENNFTDIPGLYFYSRFTEFNWDFLSIPQEGACQGMVDRKCPFPRGRALGGTTTINGLIYSRGNREDFDLWNELTSNGNWSYKGMLPYFIETEDSHINGDPGYHGFRGPLPVNYHKPISPQLTAFLQANIETGRKIVDFNGANQHGVSRNQLNTLNGRRVSSAKAFLKSPPNNLKIMLDSYVTKLLIKNNWVRGVEFTRHGKKSFVRGGEVIVSGGVFGSSRILMSSGIGPAQELIKHNVTVVQNLPVGMNLQDHTTFYGLIFNSNYSEPIRSRKGYIREYLNGEGPYTIGANLQGIGYYETSKSDIKGVPDIEVLFVPSNSTSDVNQKSFRLTNATYDAIWKNVNRTSTFIIYVALLRPRSVGSVTLKSNDPFDYPVIDPRFLTDKENLDIEAIYEAVRILLGLLKTDAMQSINASLVNYTFPACKNYEYNSKDYWFCTIRQITMNVYHPVGTCKMADREFGGVVDGRARVYGIRNLRVADASVFPFSFSGHPSAPAMAFGVKLADMIKAEYNMYN